MTRPHRHGLTVRNLPAIPIRTTLGVIVPTGCCRPGRCAPAVGHRCCRSARCACPWPGDVMTMRGWAPADEEAPNRTDDRIGRTLIALGVTMGVGLCAAGVWLVLTIVHAIQAAAAAVTTMIAAVGGGGITLAIIVGLLLLLRRGRVTVTTTTRTEIR